MKTNGNYQSPSNERTAKGLRQRRSSELRKVVFDVSTQKPIEIRDGNHTKEFYVRFGLLHPVTEPK